VSPPNCLCLFALACGMHSSIERPTDAADLRVAALLAASPYPSRRSGATYAGYTGHVRGNRKTRLKSDNVGVDRARKCAKSAAVLAWNIRREFRLRRHLLVSQLRVGPYCAGVPFCRYRV